MVAIHMPRDYISHPAMKQVTTALMTVSRLAMQPLHTGRVAAGGRRGGLRQAAARAGRRARRPGRGECGQLHIQVPKLKLSAYVC